VFDQVFEIFCRLAATTVSPLTLFVSENADRETFTPLISTVELAGSTLL
jgi:hypothetical protein